MRRRIALLATGALAATGLAVITTTVPASASVGVGTSGTQLNVLVSGAASLSFACSGGKVAVTANGTTTVATPNLACSALTKAVVAADSAVQTVDGRSLDAAAFSAHPFINASLAGGSDGLYDTAQADQITLGQGYDQLYLNPSSVTNTTNDLGTGGGGTEVDTVQVLFPPAGGTATTSTPADGNLVVLTANASGTHTNTFANAEGVWFVGRAGNDTMNAAGLTTGSAIDQLRFDGGDGNDTMTSGAVGASLAFGNAGANTFKTGSGFTNVISDSPTDTIQLGGQARVFDTVSLRSGGRTVTSSGSNQAWSLVVPHGDAVARVRTGPGGGARLTTSLDRFGQQTLPPSVNDIGISLFPSSGTNPADHGLADVEAQAGKAVTVSGAPAGGSPGNIADVTIPAGSWSTSGSVGTSTTLTVTPAGGYGVVKVQQMGAASVHAPWPSQNASFAHRSVRDLLFRFPSDSQRALVASQLDAHTKTRAQIVGSLVDTDEYRSLDVERTYLDFLKRAADPSGRAYWVNSLSNGKSLRQFRSQLFGSSDYYTKAGGTNLGFLLRAYADVFGRAPDAAGQAYWLSRLDGGTERGIVARTFLSSTDARRTLAKDQYLRLLDRFPTTAEADAGIAQLAGPTGEQDLISSLVASAEYLAEP